MEVLFSTRRLQRQLTEQSRLLQAYGKNGAKRINLRLQQLRAAPTLENMRNLPGRCHELSGGRSGRLAVDVEQPYRMIFRPTDDPPPSKEDGGLDWAKVKSITVLEIVDYH